MAAITIPEKPVKVTFTEKAFNKTINTIGNRMAESGGIALSCPGELIIQDVLFDAGAKVTRTTYSPDIAFLNPALKKLWSKQRLQASGIIHSHPGLETPSEADLIYFHKMAYAMQQERLVVPIVLTIPDGEFKMLCYVYERETKEIIKAELEVISDAEYHRQTKSTMKLSNITDTSASPAGKEVVQSRDWFSLFSTQTGNICQISFNLLAILMLGLLGWVCVAVTPAFIIRLTEILLS